MSFVRISKLNENSKNCDLHKVALFYNDYLYLKNEIKKITSGFFDNPALITGKSILFKPNWVMHNKKQEDQFCLRTNDALLLAAIDCVLEMNPLKVTIGDAPIQSCDWSGVVTENFLLAIEALQKKYSVSIEIKDFRRTIFDPSKNNSINNKSAIDNYLIFDLGRNSNLEEISSQKPTFRVTNYDPSRLAESHMIGMHKYCITKELFNNDVIISVPKIKTHQKTGITGALKNLVGLNGDKDFLPHHRVGGTGLGGDCYPGFNLLRRLSEFFLDHANKKIGKTLYWPFYYFSRLLWKISRPKAVHRLDAGWHGNDTCWRMVLDLNYIALCGKSDGSISSIPQRQIYSLCDGIVGGEGDGPLDPKPLPMGIISFSDNNAFNDCCMATLMGFDFQKIPLLKSAYLKEEPSSVNIFFNGKKINLEELKKESVKAMPPHGWVGYL